MYISHLLVPKCIFKLYQVGVKCTVGLYHILDTYNYRISSTQASRMQGFMCKEGEFIYIFSLFNVCEGLKLASRFLLLTHFDR